MVEKLCLRGKGGMTQTRREAEGEHSQTETAGAQREGCAVMEEVGLMSFGAEACAVCKREKGRAITRMVFVSIRPSEAEKAVVPAQQGALQRVQQCHGREDLRHLYVNLEHRESRTNFSLFHVST
jgi:hypothetical protein